MMAFDGIEVMAFDGIEVLVRRDTGCYACASATCSVHLIVECQCNMLCTIYYRVPVRHAVCCH